MVFKNSREARSGRLEYLFRNQVLTSGTNVSLFSPIF